MASVQRASVSQHTISPRHLVGLAVVIALGTLLQARCVDADALVVTKAMTADTVVEIIIEESVVRVELEIGLQNLPAFHNLQPDEIRQRMGFEPVPYPERLRTFVAEDLVIRADGGPPLPGRLVEIEPRRRVPRDELTGEPLPAGEDAGEPVVYAVLGGNPPCVGYHRWIGGRGGRTRG